ncbi:MAG: DegT/DnrJ/EryC1/StrS aminotransferase family protein [Armatimonadetes bacterium]|nr:DegT/DnrJ/EryC1/StrS aminotransferase family protein [Armatimonadota bacterium]
MQPPGTETALCELTGRRRALLTGRGATAICLALRAAGLRDREVVLPANICPAAVCPVIYSGNTPVFCDINLTDFNVGLASLRAALAGGAAAAIIPHAYGHAAPMAEISRLCRKAGALLIEDAAAALGAEPDGAPAGSWGDCSILSFGYAKIVDAGKGGALLTDDRELHHNAQSLLAELPEWSPRIERRATDMTHAVRGWWNARRTEPRLDDLLGPLWDLYEDVHLWRLPHEHGPNILRGLAALKQEVTHRQANFGVYHDLLADDPVIRAQPRAGSVCWRYTCLVDHYIRDAVVDHLRMTGMDVSTLYPAAHRQFESPVQHRLPNCDRLEREVINLWVAPPLTQADTQANAKRFRAILRRVLDSRSRET